MKGFSFLHILIVTVIAMAGYGITSMVITQSTIQYSTPNEYLVRKVNDASDKTGKTDVVFRFKIHSLLPADTSKDSLVKKEVVKRPARAQKASGYDDMLYHQNPVLLVWVMLISVMVAIAAGSFPIFLAQIRNLRERFHLKKTQVQFGWLYAFIIGVLLMVTNKALPGYYRPEELINDLHILFRNGYMLFVIVGATIVLMFPVFVTVYLTGAASNTLEPEKKDQKNIENALQQLTFLNETLQKALQMLAIVVVFSVLTSSALGMSIRATVKIDGFDLYPSQMSYLYGMYFTVFLCIIYVPVYYYLKYRYNKLRELAMELDLSDKHPENDISLKLFGKTPFEGTVVSNIKLALTLLSPLLSGFLPEGLHFM